MKTLIEETELIKNLAAQTNLRHIAIIMDGNRRWAKRKNLPPMFGHKEGVRAFKRTIGASIDFGIKHLTVYAFSTENWGRKRDEVDFLMKLLGETVRNEIRSLQEKNVKVRIIGDLEPLGDELKYTLKQAEEITSENTGLNLQIAINYGARNEIIKAVKQIINEVKDPKQVTDELISKYLYTSGVPDPDLLIRTGGENRLSNFLLWQMAYTEFYITEDFWPDFGKEALGKAITLFAERNRRFGKD